ncbi:MAG: pentapeptide repeat-containing protein [Gemmatimonadota bacterium]
MSTTHPKQSLDAAHFFEAAFTDLELTAADLSGKEFEGCTFRRCKLPESRWSRCVIEDSVFEDCDLSRMAPQQLALRTVLFKNTKLVGVTWKGLEPGVDVSFEGCDLRYASFVGLRLKSVRIAGCSLRDANFFDTDLTNADFGDSDLTGSTIQGCTLAKANFSRAKGVFVNPATNVVKGARIPPGAAFLLAQSFGMVVEVPEQGGGV